MARMSIIGGSIIVAFATLAVALPAAHSIAASKQQDLPIVEVNRSAKGDKVAAQRTIAVKRAPTETARDIRLPEYDAKRRLMDGCDPMFSPVTVPTMAHVAGRCVG